MFIPIFIKIITIIIITQYDLPPSSLEIKINCDGKLGNGQRFNWQLGARFKEKEYVLRSTQRSNGSILNEGYAKVNRCWN